MSKQDFEAAGDYSCQTVYMYSLGQLESPSFTVFVQGKNDKYGCEKHVYKIYGHERFDLFGYEKFWRAF